MTSTTDAVHIDWNIINQYSAYIHTFKTSRMMLRYKHQLAERLGTFIFLLNEEQQRVIIAAVENTVYIRSIRWRLHFAEFWNRVFK